MSGKLATGHRERGGRRENAMCLDRQQSALDPLEPQAGLEREDHRSGESGPKEETEDLCHGVHSFRGFGKEQPGGCDIFARKRFGGG
jgi:hypothetical protein